MNQCKVFLITEVAFPEASGIFQQSVRLGKCFLYTGLFVYFLHPLVHVRAFGSIRELQIYKAFGCPQPGYIGCKHDINEPYVISREEGLSQRDSGERIVQSYEFFHQFDLCFFLFLAFCFHNATDDGKNLKSFNSKLIG